MSTWNTAFEAAPADDVVSADFEDSIRELKTAFMERFEKEHAGYVSYPSGGGSVSADGRHLPGSAKAYLDSALPTLRPDGTLIASTEDSGRLACLDSAEGTSLHVADLRSGLNFTNLQGYERGERLEDLAAEAQAILNIVGVKVTYPGGLTKAQDEIVYLPGLYQSHVDGATFYRGAFGWAKAVITVGGTVPLSRFYLQVQDNLMYPYVGKYTILDAAVLRDSDSPTAVQERKKVATYTENIYVGIPTAFELSTPVSVGASFALDVLYGPGD